MNRFDLEQPLLNLRYEQVKIANWTLRHAMEGVQIFGGIGSGKTSGSGRILALKYLEAQFGGLVLTVKPDEKELWQDYCNQAGRSDDLIIIGPDSPHRFNFVEYISRQSDNNEAITENIVEVFKTVIRASEEKDAGKGDDSFWESALDMLMFNIVDLCKLAYGSVSVQLMYEILSSLPKPNPGNTASSQKEPAPEVDTAFNEAFARVKYRTLNQFRAWKESISKEEERELKAKGMLEEDLYETYPDIRLMRYIKEFFFESFKYLSPKTRSILEFKFSGFLFRLLREPMYSLFCKGNSSIVPEDCLEGKIILIDLPVKQYHKVGRDCQILFKYLWQRSMERRKVEEFSRPVFLWADQAQNFLHEHDSDFQATARSSRISTVYITQNLPNYYAAMGGQKADYRVKSFMGTLATKIFHANADIETNRYASDLFGEADHTDPSMSVAVGKDTFTQSQSLALRLQKLVRPEAFVSLKTGGPANKGRVQGYFHRQGDFLFGNANFYKATFNQKT